MTISPPAQPPTPPTSAPTIADAELALVPGAEPVARSNWQLFRRRFLRHKLAVVAILILLVLIVACFGAGWLAPYPKNQTNLLITPGGPSAKHWFGTNPLGQDMLTQVMYGGQISLKIGLAVAFISTMVGVFVGALAGYYGGWIDQGLSRFTDLFLIVPELAILGVAIQRLGRTDNAFIIVLAGLGWMYIARVVRGQVLSVKEKEFIEAARAAGASSRRIIVRHILPNCIGPIMVNATLAIAAAVIAESTLTYLGLGLQPPDTSWGILLNQAESAVTSTSTFYLVLFPGLMLILTVLAVNFLGDGLRDAFDPRSEH
ncbi:MAG TPA: ABC transporter permease [Acidimicrobiia bacterium]|nr:ABC transporter permease [Acidimicrobiia bacterium]